MARKTNTEVNGNKYYRVVRTIGHKPDGTPIKKQFYGSGINEANEKADQYMQDLELGFNIDNKINTINTLLPEWLFSIKKNEIKPTTFETYESTYRNYIEPDLIANRPIKELKSMHIQQYYSRLKKGNKIRSNRKMSSKKIKSIHKLLHLFFVYCEKEGYIFRNPCNNVTIPKEDLNPTKIIEKKKKFDFFTEEEIPVLIKAFEGSLYQDVVVFALATGMRQGEILGLQWEDIDFENKLIHVVHNLSHVAVFDENKKKSYRSILGTPKTKNSIRTIPINDTAYKILTNIKQKNNIVFNSGTDTYIFSKNLLRQWKDVLNKSNIRYRKFHDLRHTFATLMLSKGCDLITLKELMGHSSIKITEIYLEAIPKFKDESIKKMDFINY